MANKKITQLNTVDTEIGIGSESMFPVASGSPTDTYITSKVSSVDIAKFVLNPMPIGGSTDISSIGFTGNSEIKFKKTNWVNASNADVESYPYLQVRKSDGQLVTGSGVAFDSATVPWDHIATSNIDMQHYDITGDGFDIKGIDKISFYNANLVPPWDGYNTYIDVDSNVPEDLHISADSDLELIGQTSIILTGRTTPDPISAHGGITVGAYFSGAPSGIVAGQPRALIQFSGTDVEIDPVAKLTVNEIKVAAGDGTDYGNLVIDGASRHEPYDVAGGTVYWAQSNIQYDAVNTTSPEFDLRGAGNGQTLTLYIENLSNSTTSYPTFVSGATSPNPILWGGTGGPPQLEPDRTNVYTFVCLHTGIFASAITGYAY